MTNYESKLNMPMMIRRDVNKGNSIWFCRVGVHVVNKIRLLIVCMGIYMIR